MANKRMFSKDVIETDHFLSMPVTSQMIYIHLSMNADDEGFVRSPKTLVRTYGGSDDDVRILVSNGYLHMFESGIALIIHWNINNCIQKDRKKETIFQDEKSMISIGKSKKYNISNLDPTWIQNGSKMDPTWIQNGSNLDPTWIQNGSNLDPQIRLDQNSIDQDRIDHNTTIPPRGEWVEDFDSNRTSPTSRRKKTSQQDDSPEFTAFWKAYPRKAGKGEARKALAKALKKTTLEVILPAVEVQKTSEQWQKEGGAYIPYPATWLNQERWDDDLKALKKRGRDFSDCQ